LIRAILTDIEGTTSSIAFVKEVLFPYARDHIAEYIYKYSTTPDVRILLDEVCAEVGRALDDGEIIDQLMRWIDEDRKVSPLKTLQGMLWQQGYQNGEISGHIYKDAVDKLKEWHARQIKLYVYSSGSVAAQKLLFGFSKYGDLTALFSGYFDTRTGQKREPSSYKAIAETLNMPASDILFLSDTAEELDAARSAGMLTLQLVRTEDGTQPADQHAQVHSFAGIDFDNL
jgi:enolase-phosphatase E1